MAPDATTRLGDMIERARAMAGAAPMTAAMAGPQMERFWQAQDAILEEAEAFSRGWFERRHEAARSALDAVRKANGNGGDPAATVQAMSEWQQHCIERLAEDARQWVELCSRCAGQLATAELEAAERAGGAPGNVSGSGNGGTQPKRTKPASRARHATPV